MRNLWLTSIALAATGVLAGTSAFLDRLFPAAPLLALTARAIGLTVMAAAVVVGFVFLCDKCDSFWTWRRQRILRRGCVEPAEVVAPRMGRAVCDNGRAAAAPDAALPVRFNNRLASPPLHYALGSRFPDGRLSPAKRWIGQ